MPEYIVKSGDRNMVIKSDKFEVGPDTYNFYTNHSLVAAVGKRDVLAVMELGKAYQSDYPYGEPEESVPAPDIAAPTPVAGPRRIEKRMYDGKAQWGFVVGDRFAPYGNDEGSERYAQMGADSTDSLSGYYTVPLSETEVIL